LGPAKFALGIAINHDHPARTISLSQTTFIDRMIEHFGQVDAYPCDTQMVAGLQLYCPDLSIPPCLEVSVWKLQYLKEIYSFCLTLGGINSLYLLGYSDSDYTNCVDTSCSIGGYCFSLGSGAIS